MPNKPCPFCGGTDVCIYETFNPLGRVIGCDACGAQAGAAVVQTSGDGTQEERDAHATEAALAMWNTRAPGSHWVKPSQWLPEAGDLVAGKGYGDVYHLGIYARGIEVMFADSIEWWMKLPEPEK